MTINEAIAHAMKVAEQNDTQADKWQEEGGEQWGKTTACRECAADHRQLAEWLRERKDLREENKVLMQECDRLIKEKGELNELKEKAVSDIWRREARLREAKRLLKSATNVLNMFIPCDEDYNCSECKKQRQNCDYDDSFKWRYTDEALALIGEDGENNA